MIIAELLSLLEVKRGGMEDEARRLFDNMENSIASVQKWSEGELLKQLLEKGKFPKTESKEFQDSVKNMYAAFEDLKMSVVTGMAQLDESIKGEYNSFKSWKAAVKKKNPEAWIEGDEDIAQAMVGPKPYKHGETKSIGEWDGAKGELFESQAARNAAEAGRGQSARDFKGKKTPYSGMAHSYWKDDAKDKGYTIKKVSGDLMKGDQTWHAFDGDKKVGEFTEKEEGRGGWLIEATEQPKFFDQYKKIAVKHGWKQRADHMHHPLHGTIEVNHHGEWKHLPHGATDDHDGFGGSNEANFEKHLKRLQAQE